MLLESFDLESDPATVTVQAAYSKRRRTDTQEIRADLAELLRPWLATKRPGERVFNLPQYSAAMLRADLAAARQTWLSEASDQERAAREASDFLSETDHAGRVADFHALRHTYITMLGRSNAPLKAIQELARHSTPTLTMQYSHARLHDRSLGRAAKREAEGNGTQRDARDGNRRTGANTCP